MAGALQGIDPELRTYTRLPCGLWHLQDLYAVIKPPRPELAELEYETGPNGFLDELELSEDGRAIELKGWALGNALPMEEAVVELRLDGETVLSHSPTDRRPDIGDGGEHLRTGFSIRLTDTEPFDLTKPFEVAAVHPVRGTELLLHSSILETAPLCFLLREMRLQSNDFRAHFEILERSRFGRLRRRWMALKRLLGR